MIASQAHALQKIGRNIRALHNRVRRAEKNVSDGNRITRNRRWMSNCSGWSIFWNMTRSETLCSLKTVHYYSHVIRCLFHEGPEGVGVLLLLPGGASSFDRRNYPGTDHVVFIAAPDPAILPELLQHVPRAREAFVQTHGPLPCHPGARVFQSRSGKCLCLLHGASRQAVCFRGWRHGFRPAGQCLPGYLRRLGPFAR